MHFATIPAKGQGVLMVKYNLTLERLFKFQDYPGTLKREDVKPGDKFQLRMSNVNMIGWWAFGDLQGDLKEKKFVGDWETPNADGKFDTLVEGEKSNVEMMKQDGWVFSEKRQDLNMTTDTDEGVVIEFVEQAPPWADPDLYEKFQFDKLHQDIFTMTMATTLVQATSSCWVLGHRLWNYSWS